MNYPNNHKHKFFQKDHEKMMCSECEFELDGEYYVGYVLPLEEKIASMEKRIEEAQIDNLALTNMLREDPKFDWSRVNEYLHKYQNKISVNDAILIGTENAAEKLRATVKSQAIEMIKQECLRITYQKFF